MSYIEASWKPEAEQLGYKSEREMLQRLYDEQGFSLDEICTIIGKKKWNVRRRLIAHGIKMRGRGGPNRLGRKLLSVSHEELFGEDASVLAMKHGCGEATVYVERKWRQTGGEV